MKGQATPSKTEPPFSASKSSLVPAMPLQSVLVMVLVELQRIWQGSLSIERGSPSSASKRMGCRLHPGWHTLLSQVSSWAPCCGCSPRNLTANSTAIQPQRPHHTLDPSPLTRPWASRGMGEYSRRRPGSTGVPQVSRLRKTVLSSVSRLAVAATMTAQSP